MFEDRDSGGEIPDEYTGDWVYADGEWHREIYDPINLDPADVITGCEVPIPSCPTGAGLAIMLAGTPDADTPDALVLDRIVGFERLAAWAAAGQARALAELTTRRTADDPNELPYAVEEVALALSCSRMAAGSKVALATDLAQRLPATLQAWEQGRICAARARVLSEGTGTLTAEDAAFVEEQLLDQAATLSPSRLKVKVAALADSLDPREIEDRHEDAAAGRRVIKEPREDGMACLWALLPADAAATLWAAVNARAEAGRDPDDTRTADQRRADALTDLGTGYLTGATTIDPATGQTGQPPTVPAWAQVQVKLPAELLLGTSTE
ncbi:MAG: 13E12 repeat family protein, partial [Actinomycetota bacterium]|nr:13E12 repeat family protein [Actinomycetota bacterium]